MNEISKKSINDIVLLIETHRKNAYRKINEELVTMYYEIGKYLSHKVSNEKWGNKVIDNIADEINKQYPTIKGFTRAGIYRMIQFYDTYCDSEIVAPLVRQISWTNNILIFSHKSTLKEKEFYIRLCIKNNYSKRELERQLASQYYERYMLSNGKANESLETVVGEEDCPNTRILDQYSLEFLDLPNNYAENDLRKAIVSNLKNFVLEIGNDFSFVGEEYRLVVGGQDFYIDLLFYNRTHCCLVAIELKIDDFKPEYISKMDFYLEALDRQVKKENENPSVGIILCASKNDTVVEYSFSRTISSTAVSEYSINIIDRELLENKLNQLKEMLD